jgi:hypothetical protein
MASSGSTSASVARAVEGRPSPSRQRHHHDGLRELSGRQRREDASQAGDDHRLRHLWGENVLTNLEQRKLVIDKHVPVHGARESFADMVKTIRAKAT